MGRKTRHAVAANDRVLGAAKLSDLDITKSQSSKWQRLPDLDQHESEPCLTGW